MYRFMLFLNEANYKTVLCRTEYKTVPHTHAPELNFFPVIDSILYILYPSVLFLDNYLLLSLGLRMFGPIMTLSESLKSCWSANRVGPIQARRCSEPLQQKEHVPVNQ